METVKEVVEQTFEELRALLRPDESLIVNMEADGHMTAGLIDGRDGGFIADGLNHVVNVLANRIK